MFMQNLSNLKLLRTITLLLTLLLLAKAISIVVWWYLPAEGIELNIEKSYRAQYQRVDFKNMLIKSKVIQAQTRKQVSTIAYSINSLVLKGLYGSSFNGFAIVAKKSAPKRTSIISVGEVYAGYKLKKIELFQVIFTKSAKDYILVLENKTANKPRVEHITAESTQRSVSKADIKNYSNNPSKIWKDIAITPFKRGGKLVGFKVNRIKPGSKMADLGLKKGDLIIRANNIELTSFKDVLNLYKKIDMIETLSLVVLRNNQEKEIIYDIH